MRNYLSKYSAALAGLALAVALTAVALFTATLLATPASAAEASKAKPTILLVHGAFAESSSWDGVTTRLVAKGYTVIAVAIPLRSVKSDANYLDSLIDSIGGPVVLVGHSYGGNVISNAGMNKGAIKALVYVAGVAPEVGESAASLGEKFAGGTLGPSLAPAVVLADGSKDLYIRQDKYHEQFAADVSAREAQLMATTQRPITEAALGEPSTSAAWKAIPSWFIYGSLDRNIPAKLHAFMARRAGAKEIVEVQGASHAVLVSHPDAVAKMIDEAALFTK